MKKHTIFLVLLSFMPGLLNAATFFSSRGAFTSATNAQTVAVQVSHAVGFGVVSGDMSPVIPGSEYGVSGAEHFDIVLSEPVKAFGMYMHDGYDIGFNVNSPNCPHSDSSFTITYKYNDGTVASTSVNPPKDSLFFVGIASESSFNKIEVRENGAAINEAVGSHCENDFIGGFIGSASFDPNLPPEDPEPITISIQLDPVPSSAANQVDVYEDQYVEIALLGSSNFNVGDVDRSSVKSYGLSPASSWMENVNGDGYSDLVLRFSKSAYIGKIEQQKGKVFFDKDRVSISVTGKEAGDKSYVSFIGNGYITIRKHIDVGLDVQSMQCPNPIYFNEQNITVVLNGSSMLDIGDIDVTSLKLFGLTPVLVTESDISTLYEPLRDKQDFMSCNILDGDGYSDLVMIYDTKQLITAIEESLGRVLVENEPIRIVLQGMMKNNFLGTSITGEDFVVTPKEVTFDYKPASCHNIFNLKKKCFFHAVILGSEDVNPILIRIDSIMLEGVAPVKSRVKDISYHTTGDSNRSYCRCIHEKRDGHTDLLLTYKNSAMVDALNQRYSPEHNDELNISIHGTFETGYQYIFFEGADTIKIKDKRFHSFYGQCRSDQSRHHKCGMHKNHCQCSMKKEKDCKKHKNEQCGTCVKKSKQQKHTHPGGKQHKSCS